jgi:hypothetical protein
VYGGNFGIRYFRIQDIRFKEQYKVGGIQLAYSRIRVEVGENPVGENPTRRLVTAET